MIRKKLEYPKETICCRIPKDLKDSMTLKISEESISLTDFINQAILLRLIIPNEIMVQAKKKADEFLISNIRESVMEYLNKRNIK